MTGKAFLATTALVVGIATSVAAPEPGGAGGSLPPFAATRISRQPGVIFSNLDRDPRNARFVSWFGYRAPQDTSTILYQQSASSGFSAYAIPSWRNDSAPSNAQSSSMAADDFKIREPVSTRLLRSTRRAPVAPSTTSTSSSSIR